MGSRIVATLTWTLACHIRMVHYDTRRFDTIKQKDCGVSQVSLRLVDVPPMKSCNYLKSQVTDIVVQLWSRMVPIDPLQ